MFPQWLTAERQRLFELIERDQLPHALLIHGPAGTGRRLFTLSIVGRLLDLDTDYLARETGPGVLFAEGAGSAHPDLFLAQPPPEKRIILIEHIRALIEFLHLTSHQGGYKVAIVNPAHALNRHSENSLLKTLEEPPGASVIILITDALSRLAPTIVSRCQRLRLATPPAQNALDWLRAKQTHVDWAPVLEIAGGAPIRALEYQQAGVPAQVAKFAADIDALERRQKSPAAVAKRWESADPELCLNWLYQRIGIEIRTGHLGSPRNKSIDTGNDDLQIGAENLNIVDAFAELRHIGELQRLHGHGLNMNLQISAILTRWYGRRADGRTRQTR